MPTFPKRHRTKRQSTRKRRLGRGFARRLGVEGLEDRRMLSVSTMTFDSGTTTMTSHSEAGMTAAVVDAGDSIYIGNFIADPAIDNELSVGYSALDGGPVEFVLDSGGEFNLLSITVEAGVDSKRPLVLTASSGATVSLTSIGVHALPAAGWSNITSFVASTDVKPIVDDVVFEIPEIPNVPPVVDLNGLDEAGIDFQTLFAGNPIEIADSDAALFDTDGGIAVTPDAIFVVNETGEIIKVDPATGSQSSIGNSGALIDGPGHLVVDEATGLIYVVDRNDLATRRPEVVQVDPLTGAETSVGFFGDGKPATGQGIAIDSSGNLIVNWVTKGDYGVSSIDRVTGIETVIGIDSSRISRRAHGVAVEPDGSILASTTGELYRVDPTTGSFATLSTGPIVNNFRDVGVDTSGNIYVMESSRIAQVDSVSGTQTLLATVGRGVALALDGAGDLVFLDEGNLKAAAPEQIIHVDAGAGTQTVITSGNLLNLATGIDVGSGVLAGDFISSLTVTITNLLDGPDESLAADTTGTDITASYDAGTGVLSLTGVDTAANYQAVLRTITYNNIAAAPTATARVLEVVANDGLDDSEIAVSTIVLNRPPVIESQTFSVEENTANGTAFGTVVAGDPDLPGDSLSSSEAGGTGAAAFDVLPDGQIVVADSTLLDYEDTTSYMLDVTVTDSFGATATATMTIGLVNVTAVISGTVFLDVDGNGLFDGSEIGIDGVPVELYNDDGTSLVSSDVTEMGGAYAFEVDDEFATYRIRETQPTGVDDGAAILGDAGGDVISSNEMQLTLTGVNAEYYDFTEVGQTVQGGDTATIGFWQNKHGQSLIKQGGDALVAWLNDNFGNVFGDTFSDGVGGDDAAEVASFYKNEFFKKKLKGTPKVDAQFMSLAFATFFTSSNLSGDDMAADYGFNVTETGIGTKVVNVGDNGAAFNADDYTDMAIMALLLETNNLTGADVDLDDDEDYSHIYDLNGDGILDATELAFREMANDVYSSINEGGDI